MRKQKQESSDRRFLRGAQVADTQKIVAARERKRLRKQAKSRQGRARLAGFLKTVFGVGFLMVLLFFLGSRLAITTVTAENNEIREAAEDYVYDWPNRLKPFFNESELAANLAVKFPTIDNFEIDSSLFSNRLSIHTTERVEFATWTDVRRAQRYLIDKNGVAFMNTDKPSENLINIIDTSGVEISLGQTAVSGSNLSIYSQALAELESLEINPSSIRLDDEPLKFEVELTDKPYYLILAANRSIDDQIQDVNEFFSSKQGRGVSEYADFRVSDKVFYK